MTNNGARGSARKSKRERRNFSSKGECKEEQGRREMAVVRGFARIKREKNEGAQVKIREGAMLPKIMFH
jgi:hypothetical protein